MATMFVSLKTATATTLTVGRGDSCSSSSSPSSSSPKPQNFPQVCKKWKSSSIGTQGWRHVASNSRGALSYLPLVVQSTLAENPTPQKQKQYTVGDYMTPASELYCAKKDTTIDEALEVLVSWRITGMPVINDSGVLVGVVSDYDLLALDSISGHRPPETSLFPEAGSTWKAFKEIHKLLIKTNGKTVGDVMTPTPLVVHEHTNLEDAARILLDTNFRRLPVLDKYGKLVGLLTRGNVIRAALAVKRDVERALGVKGAAEEILRDT